MIGMRCTQTVSYTHLDVYKRQLRPMELIEECHEFFPMGEEIINSLFKNDDVDVKNERRLACLLYTSLLNKALYRSVEV